MKKVASYIWNVLEDHPWLTMLVGVFAQTWFSLSNRALWFSDEVRYANAYQNLVEHGNWMVLALNGQPYPDKPPLYFWFLWLIDKLTPADMPTVFFVGAALSGLMVLAAAYFLARTLGFNRTVSLGGVLILLSTFFLAALFHYSRMDLMFTALIVLSHACFYKAFTQEEQGRWPIYGFLIGGIATLVKGPLGFIFPLLTCVVYLAWKGELRRLFTKSMGLGFLAMLGVISAWVVGVVLVEGPSFLMDTIIGKHIIQRATKTFHHREPFYYYLIAFPLAWLPWTLFAFAGPLKRSFSLERLGAAWAGRRDIGPHGFLWIMFGATFIFLSSLSGKVLIYILPMFPALALLTASSMDRMKDVELSRFWFWVSGVWAILGLGLLIGGDLLPFPVPVRGLGVAACCMLVGAGALFYLRHSGWKAGVLASAVLLTAWLYPIGLMVAPSLDDAMSPKAQAELIGEYADKGYTPLAFKIYSGIFTYYSGHNMTETGQWELLNPMVAEPDRMVLSIREKHWEEWKDRPEMLKIIDRQNIAGMTYLVVIKD